MSDYESLLIVLSGLQQCFGNEDLLSGVVHVTQDILCSRCVRRFMPLCFVQPFVTFTNVNVQLIVITDNNQLDIRCQPDDVQSAAANVENCVRAIEHWNAGNRLNLNSEKLSFDVYRSLSLIKMTGGGPSLTLVSPHACI